MSKKYYRKNNKNEKYNGFASNARNSTKGSKKDVLNRQEPKRKYLTPDFIKDLVGSNDLARLILTAPIEDVLKNGLDIKVLKEDGTDDIESTKRLTEKLDSLDYIEKIMEFVIKTRQYGYAVMYLNTQQNVDKETKDEIGNNYSINALEVFDRTEIVRIKVNESKFDLKCGQVYELRVKNVVENRHVTHVDVHPSRTIFSRISEDKFLIGESIFTSLFDRIVIFDTTEWSIGQLIYRAVFLIYKTDTATMEALQKEGGVRAKEEEINSSTLAVMGQDDEMQVINSTGGLDPEKYVNAILTILSIHTNIPKQRLAGNSAGTLAGAEEDSKKYVEYLKRYFTKHILPIVNNLIDKVLVELKIEQPYRVELPNLLEPTELEQIEQEIKRVELDTKKLEYLEKAVNIVTNAELFGKKDKIAEVIQKLGEEDFDFEKLLDVLS